MQSAVMHSDSHILCDFSLVKTLVKYASVQVFIYSIKFINCQKVPNTTNNCQQDYNYHQQVVKVSTLAKPVQF